MCVRASADHLALRVAAPSVNVFSGRQCQSVLCSHCHVCDVDPRQRRHLLGPVMVPGSTLRQPDQPVFGRRKKEIIVHYLGHFNMRLNRNQLAFRTKPSSGHSRNCMFLTIIFCDKNVL